MIARAISVQFRLIKEAEAEREELLAREQAARAEAEHSAESIRRLQAVTDSAFAPLTLAVEPWSGVRDALAYGPKAPQLPYPPPVDALIPSPPLDRIAAGAGADVDVMVGTNTDEHRLFLATGGAIAQITAESLAGAVAAYGLPVEATLTAYREAHRGASAGDLLAAIQTDWYWRIPAIRLADAHAKSASATYMYEFAWRSPQFNGLLGACHALEIAFVFATLGAGTKPLLGTDPPQQLADTMHAAWGAFAASGDCGWPKYDLSRRATMRFDTTSAVVYDPRSAERPLWEGVR